MKNTNVLSCGTSSPILAKSPVFQGTFLPAPEPTFWETDVEVIKGCGAITHKKDVFVSSKAKQKINLLMNKYPKMEWLAYLVGNKATNTVEDIVIPKQRVTVVRVNVDGQVNVPIIGVIHSHHDMGNKFSHTDDEFINQNHDISLCISHGGINGHVRVKTECNRYTLVDAVVRDYVTEFDTADFIKEVDSLITEESFCFTGSNRINDIMIKNGLMADYSDTGAEFGSEIEDIGVARGLGGDLMLEIDSYLTSIENVNVDAFYKVEMTTLTNLINSIGTSMYEYYEDVAFKSADNVYTEDYYRLVDEIANASDSLTEREMVALRKLSLKLFKIMEVAE